MVFMAMICAAIKRNSVSLMNFFPQVTFCSSRVKSLPFVSWNIIQLFSFLFLISSYSSVWFLCFYGWLPSVVRSLPWLFLMFFSKILCWWIYATLKADESFSALFFGHTLSVYIISLMYIFTYLYNELGVAQGQF